MPARELSYLGTVAGRPGSRVAVNFVSGQARAVIDLGDLCDYLEETGDAVHLQALRRFYEGE